MAIEEKEQKETILDELIEKVEKDPIPTNIFTTEDTDPLVLLGKLNEVIARLKDLRALYFTSDSKATEALTKAIESLTKAQEAITTATTLGNEAKQTAENALEQAGTAHDTAGDALMEATDALTKAEQAITTATTLGNEAKTDAQQAITTATTLGNEAKADAQEAIQKAKEALQQVVQGLGTKVYDIAGNLLAGAKFTGHNGINVDMDETDPETFNIRLDNELVGQLEHMQTKIAKNASDITTNTSNISTLSSQIDMVDGLIDTLEARMSSVESTASANASDLEGVHTDLNNLDNRTTSLENNKADKNNSEQEITAKTITAHTGNFTNINNSFTNFNTALGNKANLNYINYVNFNPVKNWSINIPNGAKLVQFFCKTNQGGYFVRSSIFVLDHLHEIIQISPPEINVYQYIFNERDVYLRGLMFVENGQIHLNVVNQGGFYDNGNYGWAIFYN